MTLEEYTKAVELGMRERLSNKPRREVELYLMKLKKSGQIKESYDEETKASKILGSDQVNPDGFCYVAVLEYPQLP